VGGGNQARDLQVAGRQPADWPRSLNVHLASIEVAEQEAISNPCNLAIALTRAADATRSLYKGQASELAEIEARKAASWVVSSSSRERLTRNDRSAVGLYRHYQRRSIRRTAPLSGQ
jgi:hypothetical protein